MKLIKTICLSFLVIVFLEGCSKQQVEFSSSHTLFDAIQIQKFDYVTKTGGGEIYQGRYSTNKDTIYFDVTYYPDEEAPSYQDWQIQGTLFSGVKVLPSLSGIHDLSKPLDITVIAPDGVSKTKVTLKLLVYQVDFKELDKGFGRYNKVFELSKEQLGWNTDNQRSAVVIGDELIVSNMDQPFLVYNKRTGEKIKRTIPMPTGESFYGIFADQNETLFATTFVSFSSTVKPILKIYRWTDGLDKAPELFYQLPTSNVPITGSGGIGLTASVSGNTDESAQIMLDIDGRGSADTRAVRISVNDGKPSQDIDVFDTSVGTVWNGKEIAMSATQRIPYAVVMLGSPPSVAYVDNSGVYNFIVDPNNSNFLNKIIGGAHYFEFNNARYLALSTIGWSGAYRLLIFSLDDPSLINIGKSDKEKYAILNPFSVDATFLSGGDSGDVTVQVQKDGKTALVYLMGTSSGILAYELTNVGTDMSK